MRLRNVRIRPLQKTPPFRKVALGTWSRPGDPQIYGTYRIDLTNAYAWLAGQAPQEPPIRVSHMMAKAVAEAMRRYPDLNGFIRFGRVYIRESIDIFFQVMTEHQSGRMDLTGITVRNADRKSAAEIAVEMDAAVRRARERRDLDIQKTSALFQKLPGILIRPLLSLVSFLSYTLNLRFPGIPADPFAGCMISNVGRFGIDIAYAPLVPYSRVPVILVLGRAGKQPAVIDDQVVARDMVTINATVDHRFADGALLAQMLEVVKEVFEQPERYF